MIRPEKSLIPYPQKVSECKGCAVIGQMSEPYFCLDYIEEGDVFKEAVDLFWTKLSEIGAISKECNAPTYKFIIEIKDDIDELKNKSEAYVLSIGEESAVLTATDEAGVYYGIHTLTSLIFNKGNNIFISMVDIVDYPNFKVRGQFLECRYGSDFMSLQDYKKIIDYFASLKQNTLQIAVYGCWSKQYDGLRSESLYVPIKKYPFLKTPRSIKYFSAKNKKWVIKEDVTPVMFNEDFFGELAEYAKKKNITLVPMFNSLGHNSLIPRLIPETSLKNEDGTPADDAASFCTSNQRTIDVMFDIFDEIIERYMKPYGNDSIYIGFDEVRGVCSCADCKDKNQTELILEYLIKICKYLKSKGVKTVYVSYDMFFQKENILNQKLKQRFVDEGIYDIICIIWWNYAGDCVEFHGKKDEVNSVFRSVAMPTTGYFHWTLPTELNTNIQSHTLLANKLSFEGILPYGAFDDCFDKNFMYSADLSWNISGAENPDEFNKRYASRLFPDNVSEAVDVLTIMRDIMFVISDWDGNFIKNLEYYSRYSYTSKEKPYPEGAFASILADSDKNISYLEDVYKKSTYAVAFFSRGTSYITKVWKLTAMHYSVYADIFKSLTGLYLKKTDIADFGDKLKTELERLIYRIEELMSYVEDVRIEANVYTYLRNMSIMRQFILDLLEYVNKMLASGNKPVYDITDFSHIKSKIFNYLR